MVKELLVLWALQAGAVGQDAAATQKTASRDVDSALSARTAQQAKAADAAALMRVCSKIKAKDAGTLRLVAKGALSRELDRLGYLGPDERRASSILVGVIPVVLSPFVGIHLDMAGYLGFGRRLFLTRFLLPVAAVAAVAGLVANSYLQQQDANILPTARKVARKSLEGFVKGCGASASGQELDSAIGQAAK